MLVSKCRSMLAPESPPNLRRPQAGSPHGHRCPRSQPAATDRHHDEISRRAVGAISRSIVPCPPMTVRSSNGGIGTHVVAAAVSNGPHD